MRQPFAHEAVIALDGDGDPRAPGAAITLALCGSWDHEPPCPVAPHHTAAATFEAQLHLRVLFAAEPADEDAVRRTIDDALTSGAQVGPRGDTTTWRLVRTGPTTVRSTESAHARRLASG